MNANGSTKEKTDSGSRMEWKQRLRMAQKGSKEIRDELMEENMGLVYLVLKRFGNRGHDMEELFQIGAIGLMKAIERFDLERNLAFSTYAVPMITGEIKRFLRDDGMIHVSRQLKENARKIAIIREELTKTMNHEPTLEELEHATQLSSEEIVLAMGTMAEVDSISRPLTTGAGHEEGMGLTVLDQLEDHRETEDRIIDRIAVRQLLDKLDEKERQLVELRYMEGKTQAQTAVILGMNQVAVSRLEKKILLYFRQELTYNERNFLGKGERQ